MEETAVYTVTLNPAWDRTAAVEGLLCGGTNLLRAPRGDAGGKGINVSRVLHALGKKTEALGLLGAGAGDVLLARLRAEGIRCDFVRLAGECRTNTKVIDLKSGVTTEFNEPGPQADAASLAALEEKLRSLPREAVVVLAGSMPPGVPEDWYARAAEICRSAGTKVLLDSSGAGLRLGLAGGPAVAKPNRAELETLCGMPLPELADVVGAARRQLLGAGVQLAAVSLGAEGAVFVTASRAVLAAPPRLEAKSTVGAGDTMTAVLADWLAGQQGQGAPSGEALEQLAASAVAAASAKVLREGTEPPRPEEIRAVAAGVRCRVIG